jgi:hypothetical protein
MQSERSTPELQPHFLVDVSCEIEYQVAKMFVEI